MRVTQPLTSQKLLNREIVIQLLFISIPSIFSYFHVHVCLLSSLSTHFVSSFFPIYFRAWLPKSGTAMAAPAVPLATRLMIDSVLAIPVMTDMTSAHFLTTQSVFYAIN